MRNQGDNNMEVKLCPICKQKHRADYRQWSEHFKQWMAPNEFLNAVKKELEA